jgi:hypothetical protein
MSDVIYKQPENMDHNPESRSWYYDDFGNRIDKKTGAFVVFVCSNDEEVKQILLTETDYDTKPCDTE